MLAGMAEAQLRLRPVWPDGPEYEKAFFFSGEVQLDDSSPPPEPVAIYRVCNGQSQFETSTDSKGRFSFQVSDGRNEADQADASENSGPPAGLMKPISSGSQDMMPVIAKLRDCEVQAVAGRLPVGAGQYRRKEPLRRWPPRHHHAASAVPRQRT